MPKSDQQELRALRLEVAELRSLVESMRAGMVSREVKVTVAGPRRAGVFIDYQAVELSGDGQQSGKRTIELEPPSVDVSLSVKGRVGTKVTFEIEINGKKKNDEFWMEKEKEDRTFTFDFADFGL